MRITTSIPFYDGTSYIEAAGTSLETKPTDNVATGSIFVEVDTGDVYFFQEGDDWVKQFSFQS